MKFLCLRPLKLDCGRANVTIVTNTEVGAEWTCPCAEFLVEHYEFNFTASDGVLDFTHNSYSDCCLCEELIRKLRSCITYEISMAAFGFTEFEPYPNNFVTTLESSK